jgi:hypothetical protein
VSRDFIMNRISRRPGEKKPGSSSQLIAGQKEISSNDGDILTRAPSRKRPNPLAASRRDAPVTCASCGREVRRRGRLQRYCSTRCRKRGHYAQKVRRGDFSTPRMLDTALGTTLLQKGSKYNALQRAKTLSSYDIFGPEEVLAIEVFDRPWRRAISTDGVRSEISRLRARTLVESLGICESQRATAEP